MPYLAFNLNNGNEFLFDLSEERLSLGRSPRNEIVIENHCISSFHAELLRMKDGCYEVIDLKSSNGTYVNEKRVDRAILRPNDRVRFGQLDARYCGEKPPSPAGTSSLPSQVGSPAIPVTEPRPTERVPPFAPQKPLGSPQPPTLAPKKTSAPPLPSPAHSGGAKKAEVAHSGTDCYDVFISAKSEDYEYASRAASYLRQAGLRVFFSKEDLPQIDSSYFSAISDALQGCRHMLVVTTSNEHVSSSWVKHEWETFLNERISGRKRGNLVTLLCGKVKIPDLPIVLRQREARCESELSSLLPYFSRSI